MSEFLKNKVQQSDHASRASFQTVTIDSSPQHDTVEGEEQRQTSAGRQTPTSQTIPSLRGAVQSASVRFRSELARLPRWATGAIGTVVVLLLIYFISVSRLSADHRRLQEPAEPEYHRYRGFRCRPCAFKKLQTVREAEIERHQSDRRWHRRTAEIPDEMQDHELSCGRTGSSYTREAKHHFTVFSDTAVAPRRRAECRSARTDKRTFLSCSAVTGRDLIPLDL